MPDIRPMNAPEGAVPMHTLYGEKQDGHMGHLASEGVVPNPGSIMRPYKPPARRDRDNPERLLCSFEGCKAYPLKDKSYCAGHQKAMGLTKPNCKGKQGTCRMPAIKGTDLCVAHTKQRDARARAEADADAE